MKCLTAKANRRIINAVGSLAQLVEQLTLNQLVAGSNPARPTNRINHLVLISNFKSISWDIFSIQLLNIASICLACSLKLFGEKFAYLLTILIVPHPPIYCNAEIGTPD